MNLRPELQMQLKTLIREYKSKNNTEVLSYQGVFYSDFASDFIETIRTIKGQNKTLKKILVILKSKGGYNEAIEPMARVLHENYDHIDILVPDVCASCATAFALCADRLLINPYSRFGAIDSYQQLYDGSWYPITLRRIIYEEIEQKKYEERTGHEKFLMNKWDSAEIEKSINEDENLYQNILGWMSERMFKGVDNKETIIYNLIKGDKGLMNIRYWKSHERNIYPKDLKLICPSIKMDNYEGMEDYKQLNEIIHKVNVSYAGIMNSYAITTDEIYITRKIPELGKDEWGI